MLDLCRWHYRCCSQTEQSKLWHCNKLVWRPFGYINDLVFQNYYFQGFLPTWCHCSSMCSWFTCWGMPSLLIMRSNFLGTLVKMVGFLLVGYSYLLQVQRRCCRSWTLHSFIHPDCFCRSCLGDSDIKLSCDATNIFKWTAFIKGPSEKPYQEGVFQLAITVKEQYPLVPPEVRFVTKIFHPNVHFKVSFFLLVMLNKSS